MPMSDDPVERTTDAAGGDWYDAEEARRRGDALVRRMLGMPPKPQKEMKFGKPRRKKADPSGDVSHEQARSGRT